MENRLKILTHRKCIQNNRKRVQSRKTAPLQKNHQEKLKTNDSLTEETKLKIHKKQQKLLEAYQWSL